MLNKYYHIVFCMLVSCLFVACSTTKYVPEGKYLLESVQVKTDSRDVSKYDLNTYVKQMPNSRWFRMMKTELHIYDWSGRDSTRWVNRFLRRLGEPPVIYSEDRANKTAELLRKVMQSKGYMHANVDVVRKWKPKKVAVTYTVHCGNPYLVEGITTTVEDSIIAKIVEAHNDESLLHKGMILDSQVLDAERERIVKVLKNQGYYVFNKDYIQYVVDTLKGKKDVHLDMRLRDYSLDTEDEKQISVHHPIYRIGKVSFVTDYDVLKTTPSFGTLNRDSMQLNNVKFFYKKRPFLRPKILTQNVHFSAGDLYSAKKATTTYRSLGRMDALKSVSIKYKPVQRGDSMLLDTYILLSPAKNKRVSLELEGTNSAGDFGAAVAATFQHRNLFHGSEHLMLKFRGAFEMISGLDQNIYQGDNFKEYSVESELTFPRFLFPFVSSSIRKRIQASSVVSLKYDYQLRPEFTRNIASLGWGYKWRTNNGVQHRIDLIDLNFLYMPWISDQFRDDYLTDANSILAYNYEDRLILKCGYTYYYNSLNRKSALERNKRQYYYTFRFSAESAGNVLYGYSRLMNFKRNSNGEYELVNIPFAQYIKGEVDYALNRPIDDRNSLAFHVAAGVAYPYGNAQMMPFEKRYFAGGANSVRGWSVRELGPGRFAGDGNFMNQSGDIKLEGSVEFRSKLFWKLHSAFFVDAGNVWTIRDYESQPGGCFAVDRFYKEIALSYGLGLRFDFDYFVVRLDGGMKALNPIYPSGRDRWPVLHPDLGRDFTFHLAVGYPF